MTKPGLLTKVALHGLTLAPAQVWGGVRLIPILRQQVRGDLRLARRRFCEDALVVGLDGDPMGAGMKYISYVPHGLVLSWSDDGSLVSYGAQLAGARHPGRDGLRVDLGFASVRLAHRMAKRQGTHALRILPLHLAMEGYLALCFGGPSVAWSEYSRRALRFGLDPRIERAVLGRALPGFEDALRVFELHDDQVGVLVLVADSLASAFVVGHPEDYADLHRTLLEDFFCEVLVQHGLYATERRLEATIEPAAAAAISSVRDLRQALSQLRGAHRAFARDMVADLLGREVVAERVYRAGPFQLQRFRTSFDLKSENHLGEAIVADGGELMYLKTYRLSAMQTKRGYLLSKLADHRWNLAATASSLGTSHADLILRLEKAGFGYLLKDHVLAEARKKR